MGQSVVGVTRTFITTVRADFRSLWRKLPLVYDQLRAKLTPEEKKTILAHFKERGDRTVAWIKAAKVEKIQRNSLDVNAESHPGAIHVHGRTQRARVMG